MRDYKKLDVWLKAHLLTKQVYTEIVPRQSTYSIPLNIVEGCGKNTNKDFAHYLDNALGSAHEVEYTCYLIFDLGYIPKDKYDIINQEINEVKAMLIAFIKFLRNEK
ncbi:four helix bundle protein [Mucilaginibacter sp. JRF]|uniref:four helix bundle protein n=1 Tax=Mucilaginibacter sp. JRF TaxID=2780088 RepID=UPI001880F66C|nr:four helix bundle protein [Mucilaginibacter sp. JRF]MBE9583458.1 four helix bundle protein [Mucilaginibacter sp. JRF]